MNSFAHWSLEAKPDLNGYRPQSVVWPTVTTRHCSLQLQSPSSHKLVSRWPSVTPALKTNPPCRSLTALYLQAQCNQLLIAWRSRMKFPVAPFAYPFKLPTPPPDPTAVQAPTDGCVYFTCAFLIHSARPPSTSPPSQFKLHL